MTRTEQIAMERELLRRWSASLDALEREPGLFTPAMMLEDIHDEARRYLARELSR